MPHSEWIMVSGVKMLVRFEVDLADPQVGIMNDAVSVQRVYGGNDDISEMLMPRYLDEIREKILGGEYE